MAKTPQKGTKKAGAQKAPATSSKKSTPTGRFKRIRGNKLSFVTKA